MMCAAREDCIRARPKSLTVERAVSFLPQWQINPEWQRQRDAGELPEGFLGLCGCMLNIWPDSQPTREEAEWILSLLEVGTWRWMGSVVIGDSNQVLASGLVEAARRVLESKDG